MRRRDAQVTVDRSTSLAPASWDPVARVLATQGETLETPLRREFERAFGHDFADVRIHTDTRARVAAHDLGARAFTVGRHIGFGSGEHALSSVPGRWLLAHELAHVAQQRRGAMDAAGTPDRDARIESNASQAADRALRGRTVGALEAEAPTVRCQRTEPTRAEVRRDERLRRLARWPGEALRSWTRLSKPERAVLLLYMAGNYDSSFAAAFLRVASDPRQRRRVPTIHFTNAPTRTPAQRHAAGWRLAAAPDGTRFWVHPTGDEIRIILPSQPSTGTATTPAPAPDRPPVTAQPAPEPTEPPARLPPRSGWGQPMERRDGANVAGQTGRATAYEDGTITLEARDGQTTTYRPHPGSSGGYDIYDADGNLIENVIWAIDLDEVFGRSGSSATP